MAAPPSSVAVLKALADEQRLRILDFLASADGTCCTTGQGVCGCDVEDVTGLSQATVSHHMKVLAEAGLVTAEKRGRWVFYELKPEGFLAVRGVAERYLALSQKLLPLEVAV